MPHSPALDTVTRTHRASRAAFVGLLAAAAALAVPAPAHASLMSPEVEDMVAGYIAIFVLFFVPVLGIVLFWMVHVLPEKIAHKRHHPQFEAIRTLCLLSLAFGGLLWPIAWLWAYSKPVLHKMAYGTDKLHPEEGEQGLGLHDRLARLEAQGLPASDLDRVRADIDALEAKMAGHGAA